jgi:hypothetical protein
MRCVHGCENPVLIARWTVDPHDLEPYARFCIKCWNDVGHDFAEIIHFYDNTITCNESCCVGIFADILDSRPSTPLNIL